MAQRPRLEDCIHAVREPIMRILMRRCVSIYEYITSALAPVASSTRGEAQSRALRGGRPNLQARLGALALAVREARAAGACAAPQVALYAPPLPPAARTSRAPRGLLPTPAGTARCAPWGPFSAAAATTRTRPRWRTGCPARRGENRRRWTENRRTASSNARPRGTTSRAACRSQTACQPPTPRAVRTAAAEHSAARTRCAARGGCWRAPLERTTPRPRPRCSHRRAPSARAPPAAERRPAERALAPGTRRPWRRPGERRRLGE